MIISKTIFIGDELRIAQTTMGSAVLRRESLSYMRYSAEHEPENELDKWSVGFSMFSASGFLPCVPVLTCLIDILLP